MLSQLFETILTEQSGKLTVYYESNLTSLDRLNYPVFTSPRKEAVEDDGEHLYRMEIDIRRCFDSLDKEKIKWIYENGFNFYDGYRDFTIDNIEELPANYQVDSWNFIENTDGVINAIFKEGWTAIRATENKLPVYYILPSTIQTAVQLK